MADGCMRYNNPRMRIAISGYFLLHPATGSGQYTASLVRTLAQVCRDELMVICPAETSRLATSLLAGREEPWEVVPLSLLAGGDLGKLWFEQAGLPRAASSRKADLLHVPYLGPPLARPCKTMVTVHDLIMLLFPETRRSLQARAYTRLAALAARRADFILADSMATRNDILRVLGVPPERVKVVYLGYDEGFRPGGDPGLLDAVRKKYGLEREFLFYIGGLDWRKNLPRLLRAYSSIAPKPQLAIAGRQLSQRRASFPDLLGLVAELGIRDRVVFLGQVPEGDKASLYSACLALVFPSLYEGFGLTPLEAMACGAPVVCSNASSLPEVVGEAAVLFDPTDVQDMAGALARVVQDEPLRQRMRRLGLAQAQQFSWRRTAEETLEAYRQATGGVATSVTDGACGVVGLPVEAGAGAAVVANHEILTNKRASWTGGGISPARPGEQGRPPLRLTLARLRRWVDGSSLGGGMLPARPGGQGRPPLRLTLARLRRWVGGSSLERSGRPLCRPGASSSTPFGLSDSSAGKPGPRSTTCDAGPSGPSRIWGDQGLSRWNTALRRARAEASGLGGRVLEVGCGAGRFTRALKGSSPHASFFGCDLDPRSLSAGRSHRDGVSYTAGDFHALPYLDGRFQAVLLFDVLEHLREPRRALLELHRVLETGGLLHALVPCEGQPASLHWLLGLLHLGGDLKERHSGHLQRFTRRGVLSLLEEAGFRVEHVTYSMHPLGQVRDILSYVEQEEWFRRWRLDNPLYRFLMRILWSASYLESNLLFRDVPLGAVVLHVTARRKP